MAPEETVPSLATPPVANEGDDDDDDAVRPILECVVRNSGTSFVARFGFKNESNQTVSIPVGPAN